MTAKPAKRRQQFLVGTKIRELRKARSLTQSELAGKIGIQQSDLCRMETGEYKVSLDTLFRVLGIFGMNIGEFFQEADPACLPAPLLPGDGVPELDPGATGRLRRRHAVIHQVRRTCLEMKAQLLAHLVLEGAATTEGPPQRSDT